MHGLVLNDSVSLLAESTRLLSKRHTDSAHQSTSCQLATSRTCPQHSTHHHTFSSHGGERVQLHTRTSNNPTAHSVGEATSPSLLTAAQPITPKLRHNLPTPVNGSSKTWSSDKNAPHLIYRLSPLTGWKSC